MVYTGLYLAWMEAVPLWNNAAASGLCLLFRRSPRERRLCFCSCPMRAIGRFWSGWVDGLHRVHLAALGLEFLALVAFVALAATNPFAARASCGSSRLRGKAPGLSRASCWEASSFLLEPRQRAPLRVELRPVAAAEVLCLFGGLILRFCLVLAGSHWLG